LDVRFNAAAARRVDRHRVGSMTAFMNRRLRAKPVGPENPRRHTAQKELDMRLPGFAMIVAGIAVAIPAAATVAGEPDATRPLAFRAEAKVTLDAAGKPVTVEPSADLPESIRAFIRQRVATWHFSPPEQDGVTGPATTYLRLGACAFPEAGGGYRLGLDLKGNGPLYANGPLMNPPRYPKEAMIKRYGATANVTIVIGTDGLATLEGIDYAEGGNHRRDGFDASLREWVKGMRFEPEQLAGHPVRTRVRVPVVFNMEPRGSSSADFVEAARKKAAASEECRLAAGEAPPSGLQPVALDSPVRIAPAG
jgi:TonB family protein